MTSNFTHENAPDAGQGIEGSENHPPTKQEQISMTDSTAVMAAQEVIEKAAAEAVIANLKLDVLATFPVTDQDARAWSDILGRVHGPQHQLDSDQREVLLYRMNHFADPERRSSEFWSCIYDAYESNRIPSGFEFEWEPGLFVRYQTLQEFPKIPGLADVGNVEVSTSEQVFSDGTSRRIISIEAGNAELTYESVHLLIDQLKDAARSLVAAQDGKTL